MSTSQPLPPQAPIVGGKYRLGAVIGSGGVGTVYRATHLWTEREVAVKVLDSSLPHFDQLRDAFLMEARATVQLQHPNVVEVLDMGEDDTGIPYMVMELLDGPTLRDVLVEQGRLSPEDTANILVPMIDALQKAHELGIVHKDFKPENIILSIDASEFMTPKLLDFGVAQLLRDAHPRGLEAPDEVIVGTPQYMSPEQARDERDLIGPQTDVWGVGVVWYECLTGRSPFDRETPLEVLNAVCEAPIDFSELPESQVSLLQHALERSTRRRTQGLSELLAQIERSGLLAGPTSDERMARSSHPPTSERPSYARRTLQGVGSSGPRPVQFDSELLTLPRNSNQKAMLGGLALAVVVGLAAWWTIDGSGPLDEAPSLAAPTAEATPPETWEVILPEPRDVTWREAPEVTRPEVADVTQPEVSEVEAAEPTPAESDVEPEQASATTNDVAPSAPPEEVIDLEDSSSEQVTPVAKAPRDLEPRAAPPEAAPKAPRPKTRNVRPPIEKEEPVPSARPPQPRPPALVTEW